jgi:hypothetical protein
MKKNKLTLIILAAAVYLISTGISFSLFAKEGISFSGGDDNTPVQVGSTGNDYEALEFDPSDPKTEECPLNGVKYSKKQREWWESHRPLGVMIENHQEARPQSGISFADVVYEAVAEGGITRFLSVFYCQDAGIIGPVRSARVYFLDYISEYGSFPLYAHVGGANTPGPANALGQIADMDWVGFNDINQFSVGFPTFKRDESRLGRQVATEHTMYSTTSKLWEVAEERKLTEVDEDNNPWDEDFIKYTFKDDGAGAAAQAIHVEHWTGYDSYAVDWTYDKVTNTYKRANGGEIHQDRNTKKQITTKNLVLLFMNESNANDGYENNLHLLYKTKGSGDAVIFMDGKRIEGEWEKASRDDRTIITDGSGKEIAFNRGKIWFHILPLEGVVEVQ